MQDIGIMGMALAFAAGVTSFLSPCVVPLLPAYLAFLGADKGTGRMRRISAALAFTLGVMLVFGALGLGFGTLGAALTSPWTTVVCGLVIALFGLVNAGVVHIGSLEEERRPLLSRLGTQGGTLGAFALGMGISLGWTPCVGPVLASILAVGTSGGSVASSVCLLLAYALGFSVPFAVVALASDALLPRVRALGPHLQTLQRVCGAALVAFGLVMIVGQVPAITSDAKAVQSDEAYGAGVRLQAMQGGTIAISDYEGTPVIVKFWATWCPPCVAGIQRWQVLCDEYDQSGDAVLLSVVCPGAGNELSQDDFELWMLERDLDFVVLYDTDIRLNAYFDIQAYPSYLFFDASGEPRALCIGDMDEQQIQDQLEAIA